MSVSIMLSDGRFSLNDRSLAILANRILKAERAAGKTINIIYCSDEYIKKLNRRFKGENGSTDVLAFDMCERSEPNFIGEVYINLQQARRQARENHVPYGQEIRRLTIHGILHLLGYRDGDREERSKMWSRQESYL